MDNLTLIPVTNAGTVQTTFNIKVCLEDWLSYIDVKGQSAKTYTTATRQFTAWLTGKGIRNPQREDILAYRRDLENRGIKASTIQLYIVAVRQFFKWASSRGLYTESISRIIKTHFRNVGMNSDRLTAHSLRHTAATLNLLNGGTLEETRQMMRHTSINTTMIYNHAIERAKNNSEKRTAFAIFGGNL
jgi:integrase/recombinase XerC